MQYSYSDFLVIDNSARWEHQINVERKVLSYIYDFSEYRGATYQTAYIVKVVKAAVESISNGDFENAQLLIDSIVPLVDDDSIVHGWARTREWIQIHRYS